MYHVASAITKSLIENGIASEDREEEYLYGVEVMLEKVISYGSLLLLGIFLEQFIPTVLYISFFIVLRERTGGYHVASYARCYAITITIYIICSKVVVPIFIIDNSIMFTFMGISVIAIILLAPINHPNLNLNLDEIIRCKKELRWILFLEVASILFAFYFRINLVYIAFSVMGIVVCATLLTIAKITKQEVS